MNRDEFYKSLQSFFGQRNSNLEASSIGPDDNLWDMGLVDSFTTLDLLMHIQNELKRRIIVNRYAPRTFHTMRRMYDAFVEAPVEQAKP